MKYPSRLPVLLAAAALMLSCGGASPRSDRAVGSALRVEPGVGTLNGVEAAALRQRGVHEVFLDAFEERPEGGLRRIEGLEKVELPPGTEATLVVRADPPADVAGLAALWGEVRLDLEYEGILPRGLHFDGPQDDPPDDSTGRVDALRELVPGVSLSATIPRRALSSPDVADFARPWDFVVVRLYGTVPGEEEDTSSWSLERVQREALILDGLGPPWLLEAVVLGRALRWDGKDRAVDQTSRIGLGEVFRNTSLELRPGFTLEASDRHLYTLDVRAETVVGDWELRPEEALRIIRPTTSDLESLHRRVSALPLERFRGFVYHRLADAGEGLSLRPENLANALDPAAGTSDLHAGAAVERRTPRGWRFRFSVENRNAEATDLSLIEYNHLEIRVLNGELGDIDEGEFHRYELYRERNGELVRDYRRATVVRLFVPILDRDESVHSGEVEIRGTRDPVVQLRGRFLLPDGRIAEIEPATWSDGALHEDAATEGDEGPEGGSEENGDR